MIAKNDYIRHYLGVDAWHAAGYTGTRGLTLTWAENTAGLFGDRARPQGAVPDVRHDHVPAQRAA